MAPLACDPVALDRAGATVLTTGESLGSVISALTATLAGGAGMAGDDPVGAALGRKYDGAAAKLIEAMAGTRNGLCSIGDGVRVSAHNYALAEAMSDVTGQAAGLPMPQVTAPLTVGAKPPSAVGAGSSAPAGWSWVAPYIGMIWPTGDSAKLRAAAAAWTTAGVNFMTAEIAAGGGTMAAIGAQQIPEAAAINKALADASDATIDVARQCREIAAQLTSYAAKIDRVHAAILDLLSRICDPLTGIKEVWEWLTDEDEDEIKRIADDIRTVIGNFAQEVETLGDQINATLTAAVATAEAMGRWTGKEWDHFLHGTSVGRVLNHVGQTLKGVGVEGYEFLEDLEKFSPSRIQTDPVGFAKDAANMVAGELPLVGLGPDGGPGFVESWKALGKQVTHWDEWAEHPDEAFGKTLFDVGTLALPGGPLSKLGKLGRGLGDVVRGARTPRLPDVPKPPSVKPPAEPPPTGPKPPESGPPAPPGKPAPGPADGPLPHSPTESKPPVGEKPPAGEPPKPIAAPPEPGGKPAVPTPTEQTPLPHPKPAEPVPAHAPPSPGGEPTAPTPGAGLPSPPEPHLPAPPSVPMGEAPAEVPPGLGEVPHGGEPGVHPPEAHGGAPDDGGPPPGDGGPPHAPGEGDGPPHPPNEGNGPHPPGDGNAPHDSHPGYGGDTSGDHPYSGGDHDPPKARYVFPDASEFGELSEDQYRQLFQDEDGNLRYPDVNDPAKPYAIPGTVRDFTPADIASLDRQWLDRIGHPAGNWLAFEGTPYEGRSLPHTSLDKPYQAYQVDASVGLPPGWKIEFSIAAPWFGHPGGEPQLLILAPKGEEASVQQLIDTGFLKD